jgi:tetratricopeptide (TPR) repeat protein/predicted Ser/Thr protein kinase
MTGETAARTIGHYQLVRRIGSGGMGKVYLGLDTRSRQPVAVKILYKKRAKDRNALSRFFQEARAASTLHHPNIVEVYEIGQANGDRGIPFIAMEYVNGCTLGSRRGRTMDAARCSLVLVQAARALGAVHSAGIVHRDIKPENLMLVAETQLKLLDFGLARLNPNLLTAREGNTVPLTRPGALLGTVRYMSPEQLRGETVDTTTDIFSLGLVMYELATGSHPFAAASDALVLQSILTDAPLSASMLNPEIPAALDDLILRMLDKDMRRRPNAQEIERRVAACQEPVASRNFPTGQKAGARDSRGHFVGRESERRQILFHLTEACQGYGLLLCISGDAGIGKTTLIEECLSGRDEFLVARGRCSERLAQTGAYLPVLEALDEIVRSAGGSPITRLLREVAPSWYAQVIRGRSGGGGSERPDGRASLENLKLEFYTFLTELAKQKPVVLFVDDLHWADESTLDLLAYVAHRCERLAVTLIVAYRRDELKQSAFPVLKLELEGHHLCRELAMSFLTTGDVESYLAAEYPGHAFSPDLAGLVQGRTKGNPLFMAELLLDLRNRGVLARHEGRWRMTQPITEVTLDLPGSACAVIERKIGRLTESERELLEAAAVAGAEFDSAVLAAVLERSVESVEDLLADLERIRGLIAFVREDEFPDRTRTCFYQFLHVLYQEALYPVRARARRERLSRRIGEALWRCHGGQAVAVAPQLASLFETAKEWPNAVEFYAQGARRALRLPAHREAEALARRGLRLLEKLPLGEDRDRLELALRMSLGSALMAVRTYGDSEVEAAYGRAQELVASLDRVPEYYPVMHSLWALRIMRAVPGMGRELAEQLVVYAEQRGDPSLIVEASLALGYSLVQLGEFVRAASVFERAIELYDPALAKARAGLFPLDHGVGCRAQLALNYWYLGLPDRAVRCASEAVELAEGLGEPYSLAFALMYRAGVHQLRCEPEVVLDLSTRAMNIAAAQKHEELFRWSSMRRGWAVAELGDVGGIEEVQTSLAASLANGSLAARPHFLSLLADVLLKTGRRADALNVVSEALEAIASTGARCYESEALRLKAELAMRPGSADVSGAQALAMRAVEVARSQSCRGFELRALVTLVRLSGQSTVAKEAETSLRFLLAGFTEGLETRDLVGARRVLESLPV